VIVASDEWEEAIHFQKYVNAKSLIWLGFSSLDAAYAAAN
jgi:hypothetical protein